MFDDKEIARIHGGGADRNGVKTVLTAIDLDIPEIREASALLREFLSTHADEIRRAISSNVVSISDRQTTVHARKTRKRRRSPLVEESK